MLKIIDDFIQYSDAPEELKSPSLADFFASNNFLIDLGSVRTFDAIGVGYTDATEITINGNLITLDPVESDRNGLYKIGVTLTTQIITVVTNGTYVGRLGVGLCRFLGLSPAREPGFYSTARPRLTASAQVIAGAGGVTGRIIGVDVRYKIDEDIFNDFKNSFTTQMSKGYPFFLYFDKEQHRMPFKRLYGRTDNELLFQSSVNRFLYSKRFEYRESY